MALGRLGRARTVAPATIAPTATVVTATALGRARAAAGAVAQRVGLTCAAASMAATATTTAIATPTPWTALGRGALGPLVVAHPLQHFCACGPCGCLHHVTAGWLAGATPDGLPTHGNGLGLFSRLRHEAVNDLDRDILLGEALYVLHETFFIQAHQIDCRPVRACPASAADAVHIVFADVRNFIVHDVGQLVNVDAAGSNIGGHQGPDIAALEAREGLCARGLTLVAMQGHCLDAILGQEFSHVVGAKLGAGEDQHLAPVVLLDDVGQQGLFLAASDRVDELRNALHRGVAWRHLNALRILEQGGSQVANLVTEGGRKQQALLVLGNHGKDLLDVVDEAHVQHAVGLVKHQHLHLSQIEHALLHEVEQTSRCCHQNVHALLDPADLRVHADAAKNDRGGELQVLAIVLHGFFDLCRQFAGGCQHQGTNADAAKAVACRFRGCQLVQHGQYKGSGLAGARLCAAQQVVAGEYGGNGLRLNGCRRFIALLAHGLDNGLSQVEFFKVHSEAPVLGAMASACFGAWGVKSVKDR